jgi:hypothetical protein
MNIKSKAYIAGYIDGEGCLSIRKRKAKSYKNGYVIETICSVSSTNDQVLQSIRDNYGGSICYANRSPRHKTLSVLTLASKQLVPFLVDILPFLRLKRRQAEILLTLQEGKHRGNNQYYNDSLDIEEQEDLYRECKHLNKRGVKLCP